MDQNEDWILLRRFAFPCILGLFDWEQQKPQTLGVELSMGLDLDPAAAGVLASSVNYAQTLEQVKFIAEHGRWRLLESMATAMARHLLSAPAAGEERAQVSRVVIALSKPDVFEGRAVPSVELRRDRAWCASTMRTQRDGGARVEVLQESIESVAYRVSLEAGATWKAAPGLSSMVVAGRADVSEGATIAAAGSAPACVLVVGERQRRA